MNKEGHMGVVNATKQPIQKIRMTDDGSNYGSDNE
jgi:hypothetical protein